MKGLPLWAVASLLALWSPEAGAKPKQAHPRHGAASAAPGRTARLKAARPVARAHARPPVRSATTAHAIRNHPSLRYTARLRRASLPLVLIDPGHGGRDAGAVGATGLLEKDVTLSTALELRRELNAQGRFRVELTRTADVGVPLAGRAARVRSQKPALLISIHADAATDPRAHGASVYVRAQPDQGTTVKLPASPAASGAIGRALSTGSANAPPGSSDLQNAMVEQLKNDVAMVQDPAREAHLYVLATTGVPSVLVEMGFVSNRHEERLLRTTRYRRTIAHAIRDAIGDYFDKVMFRMAGGS